MGTLPSIHPLGTAVGIHTTRHSLVSLLSLEGRRADLSWSAVERRVRCAIDLSDFFCCLMRGLVQCAAPRRRQHCVGLVRDCAVRGNVRRRLFQTPCDFHWIRRVFLLACGATRHALGETFRAGGLRRRGRGGLPSFLSTTVILTAPAVC